MNEEEFEALLSQEDDAWEKYKTAMSDATSARATVAQTYEKWRVLSTAIMHERSRRAGIV